MDFPVVAYSCSGVMVFIRVLHWLPSNSYLCICHFIINSNLSCNIINILDEHCDHGKKEDSHDDHGHGHGHKHGECCIVFYCFWCGVVSWSDLFSKHAEMYSGFSFVLFLFSSSNFIHTFLSSILIFEFYVHVVCCLLLAIDYVPGTRLYWRTPSPLPSDEHCDHSDHEKESHDHSRWVTFKATITRHEFVRA